MITQKEYDGYLRPYKKVPALNALGKKCRICMEEDGGFFEFAPRSTRYGRRYSKEEGMKTFTLLSSPEKEAAAWKKRIIRAKKALERSGLWSSFLEIFTELEQVPNDIYSKWVNLVWDDPERKEIEEKYPSLKEEVAHCCILKSMYFGYDNKYEKELIKTAMDENRKYSTFARTNYDVRFTYDPEEKKAWYSEEYKNCGNGHYYIALDENTALFIEDD